MLYQLGRYRLWLQAFFLSTWVLLGGSACVTHSADKASSVKAPTTRRGLIWEAKRGSQLITLVGTMHIGISPDEIPKWLWTRLDHADTLITEVDLAGMNGGLIRRYLLLPDKQDLETLMGAEDWHRLRSTVIEAFPHISDAQLRRMTPLAACSNLMLAEAQLAQKASPKNNQASSSNRDEVSMDQFIMEQAKAKGKTLKTLETLEEQFSFLGKVFTLDQLREMLKESAENRAYYQQLTTSFKEGDSEAIDSMVGAMPANLRELLLDQRNQNWGKKLPQLLSPRETMIAVGAAHLGGKQGLLTILEAQGFQLKPLKP